MTEDKPKITHTLIISGTCLEVQKIMTELIERHGNIPVELLVKKYDTDKLIMS